MYLIDGSNLAGVLLGNPQCRKEVLQKVLAWARKRKNKVILVFDGPCDKDFPQPQMYYGNITVVLSGGTSADDWIIRTAKDHRKSCVVVTNDGDLTRAVQSWVQRVERADHFAQKLP